MTKKTDDSAMDFDSRDDEPARGGPRTVKPRMVPGRGLVVPKSYLRDCAQFSAPMLEKFRKEGAPIEVIANGVWQVSLGEFIRWYANRMVMEATGGDEETPGGTLDQAKKRDREAQAGLRELQLQKARGEVITINDAAQVVEREYGVLRSKLLAIPSRVAQKLGALAGLAPATCEDVVSIEVNDALEAIVNHDSGEWTPDVEPATSGNA